MHTRRLASFVLGAWLVASVVLDFCVIQNFRAVDRFLSAPDAASAGQIQTLGGNPAARAFLRREVGELNGYLFEHWEYAQLAIGALLLLVLIFGQGGVSVAAVVSNVLMLATIVTHRVWLTPEITRLGRLLDDPASMGAETALFWKLHGLSSGFELLKLALGLIIAGILLKRHSGQKIVREPEPLARAGA